MLILGHIKKYQADQLKLRHLIISNNRLHLKMRGVVYERL